MSKNFENFVTQKKIFSFIEKREIIFKIWFFGWLKKKMRLDIKNIYPSVIFNFPDEWSRKFGTTYVQKKEDRKFGCHSWYHSSSNRHILLELFKNEMWEFLSEMMQSWFFNSQYILRCWFQQINLIILLNNIIYITQQW